MSGDIPVLYAFRRCPYAMRARMAVFASKTPVELREVVLRNKPAEMLEASAKGTVPVLVLPDGKVIDESFDIMLWALDRHDPEAFLSANATLHDEMMALIAAVQAEFKPHLDRYKYPNRYEAEPPADHRRTALAFLIQAVLPRLQAHTNLFADRPMLADIAIFPFVRQFANTDRDWFEAQAPVEIRSWLDRHVNSSLFENVMAKYPAWESGQIGPVFAGGLGN